MVYISLSCYLSRLSDQSVFRAIDITFVCAVSVVQIAFATAIVAGDFGGIMREFEVSEVVVALTVSLMIIGFGIGPLIMAPLVSIFYTLG